MEDDEWAQPDVQMMAADPKQQKLLAYAKVEVALVRRVCDLSDEQLKELATIDDKWVNKISNEQAINVAANNGQPGLIAMFFGARPAAVNQRQNTKKGVRIRIDERIAKLLTDQQHALYEKEREARDKFRSEAVADALIESLHPRLGLTEEQRAEIKKKITPWAQRLKLHTMYYFSGNNYYPNIPEHYLSPILTKEQMLAYRGLQRHLFTDENFNDGNVPIVIKQ